MVQYIQNPQNQILQYQTLKPNIKKIFLKNFINFFIILFSISIVLFIINLQVGLDVFLLPFKTFGIDISTYSMLLYLISIIIGIFIFLLLVNYLIASNSRYEFNHNKLVLYENVFLVFIKSEEIPYQNIVKVTYNKNGVFNKILNSGTIVLELTGMKEDKIKMEFIDNVEQTAEHIENIRRRFMYIQQAQFTEKYRVDNILNRFN